MYRGLVWAMAPCSETHDDVAYITHLVVVTAHGGRLSCSGSAASYAAAARMLRMPAPLLLALYGSAGKVAATN